MARIQWQQQRRKAKWTKSNVEINNNLLQQFLLHIQSSSTIQSFTVPGSGHFRGTPRTRTLRGWFEALYACSSIRSMNSLNLAPLQFGLLCLRHLWSPHQTSSLAALLSTTQSLPALALNVCPISVVQNWKVISWVWPIVVHGHCSCVMTRDYISTNVPITN